MSAVSPAYFEIIEFIASGTTPESVAEFRPSAVAQQKLAELIDREREQGISPEEKAELDHFLELEHILRMAKARARGSCVPSEISKSLRLRVAERATRCEYCLIHEDDAGFPHQIDHILSRKHGGASSLDNLA